MSSIFSRIIKGEIPCYKIAENESCFAFFDINPIAEGHTLVVPKIEVDDIFDLEDNVLSDLHLFAKQVAHSIKSIIPCKRIGMTVIGLEVPHAHIHLIPISNLHDMDFTKEKLSMSSDAFEELAAKVSEFYISKFS